MACTITIDATTLSATTNSAGEVIRIDVEGDTTGCDEVHVSAHDDTAGIAIGDTVAQIDASGHWTASFVDGQGFSLKGVECDDKMTIKARCASDGEDCSDTVGPELRCKPGGCPDVTVTVEQQDCTDATHRTMKFHVTVGGGAQENPIHVELRRWHEPDAAGPWVGQLHQDAFLRRARGGLQRQPDRCGAGRLHGDSRSDHRRRAAVRRRRLSGQSPPGGAASSAARPARARRHRRSLRAAGQLPDHRRQRLSRRHRAFLVGRQPAGRTGPVDGDQHRRRPDRQE